MKKIWIGITALTMALLILCTACGGGSKPTVSEPSGEPTELPSVTAPPKEGEQDDGMLSANANASGFAASGMDRETWLASLSEDQRLVEEELIGKSVDELYKAIGKPKKATYTASCMVANGEDGMLEYEDFTVSTLRANGKETVMGTAN